MKLKSKDLPLPLLTFLRKHRKVTEFVSSINYEGETNCRHIEIYLKSIQQESISSIIVGAFSWNESPSGWHVWNELYQKASALEE